MADSCLLDCTRVIGRELYSHSLLVATVERIQQSRLKREKHVPKVRSAHGLRQKSLPPGHLILGIRPNFHRWLRPESREHWLLQVFWIGVATCVGEYFGSGFGKSLMCTGFDYSSRAAISEPCSTQRAAWSESLTRAGVSLRYLATPSVS